MNDRELLELAAKAAGLTEHTEWSDSIRDYDSPHYGRPALHRQGVGQQASSWNPLIDDGDALRLAVKLRMCIDHNHSADQQRWVAADRNGCEGCYAPVSCVEDEFEEADRPASTRRAIVRAAAEIGKGTA